MFNCIAPSRSVGIICGLGSQAVDRRAQPWLDPDRRNFGFLILPVEVLSALPVRLAHLGGPPRQTFGIARERERENEREGGPRETH